MEEEEGEELPDESAERRAAVVTLPCRLPPGSGGGAAPKKQLSTPRSIGTPRLFSWLHSPRQADRAHETRTSHDRASGLVSTQL